MDPFGIKLNVFGIFVVMISRVGFLLVLDQQLFPKTCTREHLFPHFPDPAPQECCGMFLGSFALPFGSMLVVVGTFSQQF